MFYRGKHLPKKVGHHPETYLPLLVAALIGVIMIAGAIVAEVHLSKHASAVNVLVVDEAEKGVELSVPISNAISMPSDMTNGQAPRKAPNMPVVVGTKSTTKHQPAPATQEPSEAVAVVTYTVNPADYADRACPLYIRQMMAQILFSEAECVVSDAERSMCIWTMFDRDDSGIAWFGGSLEQILTKPGQYEYHPEVPVTERNLALVNDVAGRWYLERCGATDVGRTLPAHICFFETAAEAGWHNQFYWLENGVWGTRHNFDHHKPIANPYQGDKPDLVTINASIMEALMDAVL
ncbi:hypothetical protein IJ118_02335 [Candidatus Saccharibacteria bacterium]|nr:hypothetical protein [Candidatus Saccharibacteria bacterium]